MKDDKRLSNRRHVSDFHEVEIGTAPAQISRTQATNVCPRCGETLPQRQVELIAEALLRDPKLRRCVSEAAWSMVDLHFLSLEAQSWDVGSR